MNIIETRNLTKKFGDFTANDQISFAVKQGEIRAIIGENGAGKTTLMNMLYGILEPTSGEILIEGEPVTLRSPKDAIAHGIGMVHQHFKLAPSLTIFENVLLGAEINKTRRIGSKTFSGLTIDIKEERRRIQELVDKLNFNLDVNDRVMDIAVGARQRVEILKMLYRNVKILILDEPTAVLIPQEVEEFMNQLEDFKKLGQTIIIITHKLDEVKRCADTISVMRQGRLIDTVTNDESATRESLAEKMVGRPILLRVQKSGKPVDETRTLFSVRGLSALDGNGKKVVNDVSFDIHANEVVGIAGIEGNGQTELMYCLTGLMNTTGGTITVDGKDVTGKWPSDLRADGVAVVPEDRYRQGLCREVPVSRNLIAGYHCCDCYCKKGFMRSKSIRENKERLVGEYDIRLSADDPPVSSLSGGNAQKIIIAREFSRSPKVLLASQPTRGIDIGATEFVHNSILKLRDEGKAALIISSDLSEVVGLSDRVLVMYKGEIVGEFKSDDVSFQELGLYMSGAKSQKKPQAVPLAAGQ
ncbi:ABC transporter ATP-binding protein [Feifania hominis]|uniref:ABC transporter ATP-binding protein n=1 Tax=Feifania hominis TaxID=2763660 RepID=A0A926DEN6_9FIRM|nr:ABC transporter ATP-binding protein [Feifania hominis]MBC8536728.1 ABC transporter ATP-binding protein [Feifania hominis]